MHNMFMRVWFACAEWGRFAIQAFGGGNGDPDALRALDEANKNAQSIDETGGAESHQRPPR